MESVRSESYRRFKSCSLRQKTLQKRIHLLHCFFIQDAGLVYHPPREAWCISSGAASRPCISSRASVHLACGLMIYNSPKLRMIYKAFALIYLRKCDIIYSLTNKNLSIVIDRLTIVKRRICYEKNMLRKRYARRG